MRGSKKSKRVTVLSLLLCLVLGASNIAAAEPEDVVIQTLLNVTNVKATGVGPVNVIVGWTDTSKVSALFGVEVADDESGPWTRLKTVPCRTANLTDPSTVVNMNNILSPLGTTCMTSISVGSPNDAVTRFARVVPLLASTPIPVGSVTVPGTVLYEGVPSAPDPFLLAPVPPTNLQCNGGGEQSCVNVNSITLTWDDNSDEYEFWVMRAKGDVNPGYGTVPYAKLPADTTIFQEIIPDYSVTYWYAIVAVRVRTIVMLDNTPIIEQSMASSNTAYNSQNPGGGTDIYNGPGNFKIDTAPIPPPADPGGLTATYSPGSAVLTWNDPQLPLVGPYTDEDGWFIEFGPTATDFTTQYTRQAFVGRTDLSSSDPARRVVTFTDKYVTPDTLRCYRVRGYRAGLGQAAAALSGYSNTVCVGAIPKAPTALTATAVSNSHVRLAWVDRSTTEQEFAIQRCPGTCSSSGTWTEIGAVPTDTITFSDLSTISNTTYSYRVIARNGSGSSSPSNIATTVTPNATTPRPLNLVATTVSAHALRITWDDIVAVAETGYKVEYKVGSQWLDLKVLSGFPGSDFPSMPTPSYIDRDTLNANQTRCYRVRAIKSAALSDPSNTACAMTASALAPNGNPTGLTATTNSNTKVTLAWTDNATNEDEYRIEYLPFLDKHCSDVSVTPAMIDDGTVKPSLLTKAPPRDTSGPTSFVVGGLVPHSSYMFRVVAANPDGYSTPSNASACVQTFGPQKPIILDDDPQGTDPTGNNHQASGDTDAFRCEIRVKTPASVPSDVAAHPVGRLRIWVNANVEKVEHTDTIYAPPLDKPAATPGATGEIGPGLGNYRVDSNGIWHVDYSFRKGPNYGIVVTAFQYNGSATYESALAGIRDLKVLADCPSRVL